LDNRAFTWLHLDARGVTGPLQIEAIALGRNGPWQKYTRLQLPLAPAAHAFGSQGACICGDRSPDVQKQMGLWIVSQRLIEARAAAPCLRAFFYRSSENELEI
jgi:hypothetical protein